MARRNERKKMRNSPPKRVRVAWVMAGDLRPYRVSFVNELARHEGIELTVFHSSPRTRFGAPSSLPVAPLARVEELRDLLWPLAGQRTAWLRGTRRVLRDRFDVIICQETVHNLTTWVIALLGTIIGYRFVLHGHFYGNTHKERGRLDIRAWARRMLRRRARAFLAYTERGRDALIESGVSPHRTFVTNNTLDTERLVRLADGVSSDDLSRIRHRLGIGDDPVLLMVGRLLPEKRVDLLLDALPRLQEEVPGVSLLVIGDGIERQRLETQAQGLSRVHFLGAIYDEAELAPYLGASDLLVIPGRIGLTCVHGFTAGLPSVTASADVVHQSPEYDYIRDGENGVLVSELNAGAFAERICEVLQDKEKLAALSIAARQTARNLGMGRMVDEFVRGILFASSVSALD